MASTLYDSGREGFATAAVNWTADTIKVCLLSNAYTLSQAHDFLDDIQANRLGTDQTLSNKTATAGVCKNTVNTTFTAVAGGAVVKAIAIYKDTGNAATSRLIFYSDAYTNMPYSTNGGDIIIAWDQGANGIFKL
jgi:hypothetical protein